MDKKSPAAAEQINIAEAARAIESQPAIHAKIASLVEMVPPVLVKGTIKTGMAKAAGLDRGSSKDLWFVKPENVQTVPNLNPRVETPSYLAHVRKLADSMKANGFFQDKPLAGYVAKDGDESTLLVYEGGSRLKAVLLAKSEGADIDMIPVSVSQEGKNMEDLLVAMHLGNTGRPLSYFEQAILVKRLLGFGKTPAQISERLQIERGTVENMLKLMEMDPKVQDLVAMELLSATLALETWAEHGAKTYELLTHAHAAATAQGKGRITKRFVPGTAFKQAVVKNAEPMYAALEKVRSDKGYAQLSSETKKMLAELIKRVTEAKAPPEVAQVAKTVASKKTVASRKTASATPAANAKGLRARKR